MMKKLIILAAMSVFTIAVGCQQQSDHVNTEHGADNGIVADTGQ